MCFEKKYFKGILFAGLLSAIAGMVVHTAGSFLTMSFYMDPSLFGVWSKVMMPGPGVPPASFFVLSFFFGFLAAVLYAAVYSVLMKSIPGKGCLKGLYYGLFLFLLAGLPGALSMYLLINLPAALIAFWALENLVVYAASGLLIARLVK